MLVQLDDYVPFPQAVHTTTVCFVQLFPAQCRQSFVRRSLWVRPLPPQTQLVLGENSTWEEEELTLTDGVYLATQEGEDDGSALLYCPLLEPSVAAFANDQVELMVQTAAKYNHEALVIDAEEWPLFMAPVFRRVLLEEMPGIVPSCVFAMGPASLVHPLGAASRFRRAFEQDDDEDKDIGDEYRHAFT